MKYKVYKKYKNYTEIYTKEKETKAIYIKLDDGTEIWITEQQIGLPLKEAHMEFTFKDEYATYVMDLSAFMDSIKG